MAKLEPMSILMNVLRMSAALVFIVIMMVMFFSLDITVRGQDMERFNLELSDALAGSPLAADRTIFSINELHAAEKADPDRNTELHARSCEYGYTIEVKSLAGRIACENGNDCRDFCGSVCGLEDNELEMSTFGTVSGNCGCNLELLGENFCQCKKNDAWQDFYKWEYGYEPNSDFAITQVKSSYPVGIEAGDTVIPADLTLTVHDSFTTRLSCGVFKAFETGDTVEVAKKNFQPQTNLNFRRNEEHVCLYSNVFGDEFELDCRYLPDVTFEPFDINANEYRERKIFAYPVKTAADCATIKSNRDIITDAGEAGTVVLCLE